MAFVEREKSEKSKPRHQNGDFEDFFGCLDMFGMTFTAMFHQMSHFPFFLRNCVHCDDTIGCGISISFCFKTLLTSTGTTQVC